MEFFKSLSKRFHSRAGAYVFYAMAVAACAFLHSAGWAYGWIADLYPLGDKFVPVLFGVIIACVAVTLGCLLALALSGKGESLPQNRVFRVAHTLFAVLSAALFVYTFILLFGIDKGFSSGNLMNGLRSLQPDLIWLAVAWALPLSLLFSETPKKAGKAVIASLVVAALIVVPAQFASADSSGAGSENLPPISFRSQNVLEGASVSRETLKKGEKADAENLLLNNGKSWTPQDPDGKPADGGAKVNNSYAEIQLAQAATFNTAVIEEVGNQVQYFRLQAYLDEKWVTIYQSEKIQSMRLCSFDAVTTDRIRLSVDKFRNTDTPAKIKSIRLYQEPARDAKDFEVTAYQRLDGDVPTEILAKGDAYVKNYARFYDVYSTVIVFGAVRWEENGKLGFGDMSEAQFAKEIAALKQIIAQRSNPAHKVKLIITALADGTWGDGHNGVNVFMEKYWETVADQIIAFVEKYDFDGVDIDWEYPASDSDWQLFDKFIAKIDDGMQNGKEERILSAALSSGSLGLSKETMNRLDQVQFMAYDGMDADGYQSSLQQAEEGMRAFLDNGADPGKINIGIAAYGRPINGTPFWASWRDLQDANYWNNKYYTVSDSDQIYEGTFCSPALAGDKTAYALLSGAGGVMVFRVACDKTMDDPNSVTRGIENALKRYFKNW